ncbi:MAG: alpha/beta hydrolase [Acidobacteria bacterium]|nr:alpha/beta hydrolase [Acidobacteriota bacterium]
MIDLGDGNPIVIVPGIQGRWEWMTPAVEALAASGRVVTGSLCGEPNSEVRLVSSMGFDAHVSLLDHWLDRAGLDRVTLCGVSFGGWVALRYAVARPERVRALVFASTPGPGFQPDARQQRYIRTPNLALPLFVLTSRERMRREVKAAFPEVRDRFHFTRLQLSRMARAPISPSLMARRMKLALQEDFAGDARQVRVPTLVITGERGLDRVVPIESTHEYLSLIPHATATVIERTGHIGCVTRPDTFASLLRTFDAEVRIGAPASVAARIH